MGVPASEAMDVLERINRGSATVARAFVEMFIRHVLRPYQEHGSTEEIPSVEEAVVRLRPLASEALMAAFQQVMTEATEEAFGRELERTAKRKSSS